MSTLSIIAIIPSRYASTRLPAKALVDLCGKTMIERVYGQAKKARLVTKIIVATDDERIASVVRSFGGEFVMTPPELSSGSDRIAYVASGLQNADIIVNVQGDEPLIAPEMIDQTVRPLLDDSSIQIATPIKPIRHARELSNPNIVKVATDTTGFALYFSRSVIPHLRDGGEMASWPGHHQYYKHFGLYVYRRAALLQFSSWKETPLERAEKLEQLRFLEYGIRIKTVMTEFDSVPIDTAADAERVRSILSQEHQGIHEQR